MARNSPAKVTLGMMKGKPITTSVPVIRYHASDDELEELYPSTDEEKAASEKTTPNSSPFKSAKTKSDNSNESNGEHLDKRSSSFDLSEGTPPSDPWKMLSDIRGKITKTFEEKLSEMKNDKKEKGKGRSRDNSSVSDPEDLGDITPTEEEKCGKEPSPSLRKRGQSSRFRFSIIKTGLKASNVEENVESGIEAAELVEVDTVTYSETSNDQKTDVSTCQTIQTVTKGVCTTKLQEESVRSPKNLLKEIKKCILHDLLLLIMIPLIFYVIPLPQYLTGLSAGVIFAIYIQRLITKLSEILAAPVELQKPLEPSISVLKIQPVEEYAVIERFEGWLNELPYNYDPENYHVARTNAVYFKLEGDTLKIMETRTRIPKRAIWNEPQYTAKFTRKRLYSLIGAKVELLPEGLIRRRRWSKKYPICITFGPDGIKENVVLESPSDDEHQESEKEKDRTIAEEYETDDDISISKDINDVFEDCQDDDEDENQSRIFIFGRTDRQKEDWYRRLVLASRSANRRNSIPSNKEIPLSSSSLSLAQADGKNLNSSSVDLPAELSYNAFMSRYIDSQITPTTDANIISIDNDILWFNALIGRILFDMHKCPDMINVIQDKIQKKLSNIKLPYFMESLLISELVIGQGPPFIHKASKPTVDERGLWIDLDISYDCGLMMTVETKLNLMKLTKAGSVLNSNDSVSNDKPKPVRSPMFDSDVEDSPETSTEDEDSIHVPTNSRESTPTQSSSKKFLSMVDKLASNKYFQHAAELSYIRRAMEGVSNTEIRLMVSVSSIEGSLSINIPPPPSDRLWYGFKSIPKIHLDAKPAVGERAVNIGYVTNWIKTKLLKEFDKVVVLPNMDDLVIPLCPNFPYHDISKRSDNSTEG